MDALDTSTAGRRFRIARKRAGLTQKDLHTATGVAQATISEFEGDVIDDIHASSLVALCARVGVTAEYVLLGTRAARGDQEAEAMSLLRDADAEAVAKALDVLRVLLAKPKAEPRKRAGNGA
jgi:transcriptional regulator with XRE-family HTH domain